MFLSVDIGNTNITFGIYEKNLLINTFRLESDKNRSETEYKNLIQNFCKNFSIKACAIASVVDELTFLIKKTIDDLYNIDSFLIDSNTNLDMLIKLKNPKEIGSDRLANAYGAKLKYKLPLIVVDIGTATTFDIVSKNGEFLGGIIMPGLNLQLASLGKNTSKLPEIKIDESKKAIGDSTLEALLSGVIRGSACAIEGMISQCELELGEIATIIATGGYSKLVSKYITRKFDYVDSNLTLDGIKIIHDNVICSK